MQEESDKKVNDSHWQTGIQLHGLLMTFFTIFGIYLCYQMELPFLPTLVWALAFAVLYSLFQAWLER
jgi:hypothetical protein